MIQKVSTLLVSIPQIRAARGLLGWSQTRLAEEAGLSVPTVKRYETDSALKVSEGAIASIREALETAGVIFVEENGEGPGVRLRKQGKAAAGHPEPVGPATEVVKAMDAAISEHRKSKTKR